MATFSSVLIFAVGLLSLATFFSSCEEFSQKTECELKTPFTPCTNDTCVVWTEETVNCSGSICELIRAKIPHTVTTLVMRSTQLRVIKTESLENLDSLRYLDLSNNIINCIESGTFDHLVHLEFLNLSANPYLMSYPDGFFSYLRNLNRLFLTGIILPCTFRLEALKNLSKLKVLWFGPNLLHQFPLLGTPGNIWMPQLRELSLADNNIVSISARCHKYLPQLETLYLNGNRILALSIKIIRNLKHLRHLNMDRNIFFTPGSYVFQSKSLKYLSLNYITPAFSVAAKSFAKIGQLEELNLERSTAIFRIAYPFEKLPNLIKLNVRGNEIRSEIIENMIKRLPKLRHLDLSDNDIVSLKKSMFKNVRLDVLFLKDNWLSSVNIDSFPISMWTHLNTLDLSRNTFECDCGIAWLRRWLRDHRHNVTNIQDTKCTSPAAVKETQVHLLSEPTDRHCFTATLDSCLGVVFAIFLAINFTATITSSLHRFRWHLKYYYFKQMVRYYAALYEVMVPVAYLRGLGLNPLGWMAKNLFNAYYEIRTIIPN